MDWVLLFLAANAVSGIVLVGLGGWMAAQRRLRVDYALALFFLSWGAQLALTNTAAASHRYEVATALFHAGQILIPLPGLLLLLYASQSAQQEGHAGIVSLCRVLAWISIACLAVGITVSVMAPEKVLTVTAQGDGHAQHLGPWAPYLFDAPRLLGVSLGLVLLSWPMAHHLTTHSDWRRVAGLAFGWTYSLSFPMAWEAADPRHDLALPIIFWTALLIIATIPPLRLFLSARRGFAVPEWQVILASLSVPLAGAAAWLAPHASSIGWVLLAPGTFRLAATLLLLVPALWTQPVPDSWMARTPTTRYTALAAVLAVLGAAGLTLWTLFHAPSRLIEASTTALAAAGLAAIGIIGFYHAGHLLRLPTRQAKTVPLPNSGGNRGETA